MQENVFAREQWRQLVSAHTRWTLRRHGNKREMIQGLERIKQGIRASNANLLRSQRNGKRQIQATKQWSSKEMENTKLETPNAEADRARYKWQRNERVLRSALEKRSRDSFRYNSGHSDTQDTQEGTQANRMRWKDLKKPTYLASANSTLQPHYLSWWRQSFFAPSHTMMAEIHRSGLYKNIIT